jgi:hypothetical protein
MPRKTQKRQKAGAESEPEPDKSVDELSKTPEESKDLGSSEQAKKDAEEMAESYEREEMGKADQEAVDEEAWELVRKMEEAQKAQEDALAQLKGKLGESKMGGKSNKNKKNKNKKNKNNTRKQRR